MNNQMTDKNRNTDHAEVIARRVGQRRLRDAFRELRVYASRLGDWRVGEEIDRLEQHYSMMLRYATAGADDPGREEMYGSIVSGIFDITDRVSRRLLSEKSPAIYFNTLRYESIQPDSHLPKLTGAYRLRLADTSITDIMAGGNGAVSPEVRRRRADTEALERRLFNKVWVESPFTSADAEAVSSLLDGEEVPARMKAAILSALLLALTHYYDERKLILLLDFYGKNPPANLAMRALTGALMAMFVNRARLNPGRIAPRIEALRETTSWHDDLKLVFLQFIRSRDTERINRKMRDEVFPEMMKLSPEMARRLRQADMPDPADPEENPEWEELLNNSGLADKIKELTKMQEEGGDVMMSTFATLKTFPFFNEVANWFLPFYPEHTAVTDALGSDSARIATLVDAAPFLCDGDKYSFVFAVSSVPEAQRRMMLSQFDAQHVNEMELRAASMGLDRDGRDDAAGKYVQGLYRFFKLFRRSGEFNDPFARPLNLLQLPLLAADLTDRDTLAVVGEFYFRRGYYADALVVFRMLSELLPPDAALFQKMGYCCQHTGDYSAALDYYSQAELLDADSPWTLRRLAACSRALGRTEEALGYYRRLEKLRPDDLGVALSIGHCLLELGRPADALNYYFKVEFLDEKSTRARRPIAWASFLSGDFARSRDYYDRVLLDSPDSQDYLNMGHLSLASGNMKEAINYYSLAVDNTPGADTEKVIDSINADAPHLIAAGVDPQLLPLTIDALLYNRD